MKKNLFSLLFSLCIITIAQGQTKAVRDTTLYYASDRFEIKPAYMEVLSEFVETLKLDSTTWVEVSGHADVLGSKKHNEKLSLKRTETVLYYFLEEKIKPSRIKGYHYGSAKPIASNQSAMGRKRNRRVEVKLFRGAIPVAVPVAANQIAASGPEYVVEPRVEIDIHYNKEKFVYLVNGHRNVLHTVRDAEVVFDTNCFQLPNKSNIYGSPGKLRLDFSEMDKKGEYLFEKVGLRTPDKGTLQATYIFCLDSVSAQGLAHIRKERAVEFLIPQQYVTEGSKIYFSPDHIRTIWTEYQKPVYNTLHNAYTFTLKDEGCFAVAKPMAVTEPSNMSVTYTRKPKDIKNQKPDFYFVYRDENTIVAADSANKDQIFFNHLKSGAHGTVVGFLKGQLGSCYYAHHDMIVKHHGTKTYHPHAHLKFRSVGYFEFDKLLMGIHSDVK